MCNNKTRALQTRIGRDKKCVYQACLQYKTGTFAAENGQYARCFVAGRFARSFAALYGRVYDAVAKQNEANFGCISGIKLIFLHNTNTHSHKSLTVCLMFIKFNNHRHQQAPEATITDIERAKN